MLKSRLCFKPLGGIIQCSTLALGNLSRLLLPLLNLFLLSLNLSLNSFPSVLEKLQTPQSQPAAPVPPGSRGAHKIKTLWKWGHIWLWQMSPCHSTSCIYHFICITPRGLYIHVGLNHTQFQITIGFLSRPSCGWSNIVNVPTSFTAIRSTMTFLAEVQTEAGALLIC